MDQEDRGGIREVKMLKLTLQDQRVGLTQRRWGGKDGLSWGNTRVCLKNNKQLNGTRAKGALMAVVEVKLAHAHPLQTAIFSHPLGGVVPGRARAGSGGWFGAL